MKPRGGQDVMHSNTDNQGGLHGQDGLEVFLGDVARAVIDSDGRTHSGPRKE